MAAFFRPLDEADLQSLCSIEQRCFPTPWSRHQLFESLQHHQGLGIQMAPEHPLLGYAFFITILEEAHLLNLAIDVPWQQQGWGQALLQAVIFHAQQQGASSLLLEVRAHHRAALSLYHGAGFERIGIRKGYYATAEGTREDAWVLRRSLLENPS
ncbi:MAG: ribosomal protein S18-alanine N-acetyltransferase [Ferrovum sp.]|jgi:ribosomal-protein-alanine N-acetyltransferase|nr:ribosomal protein S18-alanine N-acetyltransferase [Ferrovum sp.]NDU87063.1 ribosomal protein S18-alanine N-acetyltransferase [Ferrovum sp.]